MSSTLSKLDKHTRVDNKYNTMSPVILITYGFNIFLLLQLHKIVLWSWKFSKFIFHKITTTKNWNVVKIFYHNVSHTKIYFIWFSICTSEFLFFSWNAMKMSCRWHLAGRILYRRLAYDIRIMKSYLYILYNYILLLLNDTKNA